MIKLNHPLLSVPGIINEFKQNVLNKPEPQETMTPSLLRQFKNRICRIYFTADTPDEVVITQLTEARFSVHPELSTILGVLFAAQDKNALLPQLEALTNEAPIDLSTKVHTQWTQLNHRLGYFDDTPERLGLYQALVHACRVMVLIEDNNNPEDTLAYLYAYRLMVWFQEELTLDGIAGRVEQLIKAVGVHQTPKPYHDVLLLDKLSPPPRAQIGDVNGWRAFMRQHAARYQVKTLELLANAPAIEAQMEKMTGIRAVPSSWAEAQRLHRLSAYQRAGENLQLAELCRTYRVPEMGGECSFEACLNYLQTIPWPLKTQDNLPAAEVRFKAAGAEYVWTRLPTDDLRALFLGVITGCCQSIGGDSEACVKDAVSLPDNGLYVLLKGRPGARLMHENPLNHHAFKIVGQSYAWLSQAGNLTLDSLECSHGEVPTEVAQSILTQFAQTVLREHPGIKFVTLGTGGGTPKDFAFKDALLPETMRMGYHYGDASSQYLIASRAIVSDVSDQAWATALDNKLPNCHPCMEYLSHYLPRQVLLQLLTEDPTFEHALNAEALMRLFQLTASPQYKDLLPDTPRESGMSLARLVWRDSAAANVTDLVDLLNYIPTAQRLLVCQLKTKLFTSANPSRWDSWVAVLKALPESDRIQLMQEQNKHGLRLLNYAVDSSDVLAMLLAELPAAAHLMLMQQKSIKGDTMLHFAYQYPQSLAMILNLYPEAERFKAINQKNPNGNTVLYLAACTPKSLAMLLPLYSTTDLMQAMKEKNAFGHTLLHRATSRPECFVMLLTHLPAAARVVVLQAETTPEFGTILHMLMRSQNVYPQSIVSILGTLTGSEQLLLLKQKNDQAETPLHLAIHKHECLTALLGCYPESERLTALQEKNEHGWSVLTLMARDYPHKILQILIGLLPKVAYVVALTEQDSNKDTVLYHIIRSSSLPQCLLAALVKKLPESDRLRAVQSFDSSGLRILHRVTLNQLANNNHLDKFMMIFELLPEPDRVRAMRLHTRDDASVTVLHLVAGSPELVATLLRCLPESKRLEVAMEKNEDEQTVLDLVAQKNPHDLLTMLDCFSDTDLEHLPPDIAALDAVQAYSATRKANPSLRFKDCVTEFKAASESEDENSMIKKIN